MSGYQKWLCSTTNLFDSAPLITPKLTSVTAVYKALPCDHTDVSGKAWATRLRSYRFFSSALTMRFTCCCQAVLYGLRVLPILQEVWRLFLKFGFWAKKLLNSSAEGLWLRNVAIRRKTPLKTNKTKQNKQTNKQKTVRNKERKKARKKNLFPGPNRYYKITRRNMMVVAFSSHARILGKGLTIRCPHKLFSKVEIERGTARKERLPIGLVWTPPY